MVCYISKENAPLLCTCCNEKSLHFVGAYSPRSSMKFIHVDPTQAIQIHKDLKARVSFGIHWATFKLTLESYMEPKKKILHMIETQPNLKPFLVPDIGGTVDFCKVSPKMCKT